MRGFFHSLMKTLCGTVDRDSVKQVLPETHQPVEIFRRKSKVNDVSNLPKHQRTQLFIAESSRQGLLIAQARRKRKKNGRRPTFKEAGKSIKRIPQSAFGFKPHPKGL